MIQLSKNAKMVLIMSAGVIVAASFLCSVYGNQRRMSLSDFGASELVKRDCSALKNVDANVSVTISYTSKNVKNAHDQLKALAEKYDGFISGDTTSSYPSYDSKGVQNINNDNASFVVAFSSSSKDFLADLSTLEKTLGLTSTGYSDGSSIYGGYYSPYSSCQNSLATVKADMIQLNLLVNDLRNERSTETISILSQAISNLKMTLQNDVSSVNSIMKQETRPSVNITISGTSVGSPVMMTTPSARAMPAATVPDSY